MIRRKLISKCFVILILLGLIGGAVYYQINLLPEEQIKLTTNTLTAQIIDTSDNTLTIRDNQNKTYTINLGTTEQNNSYIFSNQVTIRYTGDINDQYTIESITVKYSQIINGELDNETFSRITNLAKSMSLEDKVGQLLLVLKSENLIDNQTVAGCVLFEEDFKDKTRDEVINNIQGYQDAAKYPMLIGVDEEGGNLVRVSKYLRNNRFRLPQDVFAYGGMDSIISDATEKSEFLQEFGINVNLAPVADVPLSEDDYIYARSFGLDSQATSNYVKNVVSAMNDLHMGSVLKHFPGYGNAPGSSGTYHDNREYSEFANRDLLPFEAGIEAGANAILVTNNIIDSMDDQNPATLSANIHELLRNNLGYNGVILTDDISGIDHQEFGNDDQIAVKAIQAGNDLIMTSNPQSCFNAILNAVNNGEISLNQLDISVLRVLAWKAILQLL